MNLAKSPLMVMVLLILIIPLSALASETSDSNSILDNYDFEVDFVNGYFTGGTFALSTADAAKINIHSDKDWITGFRFDADKEFHGFELSILGSSQNTDFNDSYLGNKYDVDPTTWLLTSLNMLIYPTGNKIMDGRFKPFITLGPGLALLESDFKRVNNKPVFNANAGVGVKINLGDKKNVVIRIEYRWHAFISDESSHYNTAALTHKEAMVKESFYRQEFTIGLGIKF